MRARARLADGLPRMFKDSRSPEAIQYRRDTAALIEEFGLAGRVLRDEAARVAVLTIRARAAARSFFELDAKRRSARGRRPSPRMIERARRAAALDDASAAHALAGLRELAGRR